MTLSDTSLARATYEALAGVYDPFSADFGHDRWLAAIRAIAGDHGLHGTRALDAGCGTGRSFAPLIRQGFEVSACDLSPGMVARAARRADQPHRVFVADLQVLPPVGPFDLVTCLDDAVNHLLDDRGLVNAFAAVRDVLDARGLFVFDANTALTYRTAFAMTETFASAGHRFAWSGRGALGGPDRYAAAVTAVSADGARVEAVHHQRHVAPEHMAALLEAAGLRCRAVVSQRTGCVMSRAGDPAATKTLFVAERRQP
jgi:SAM-dependent methyltransferase